ncbi:hypothetical protein EZV73_01615 [Acidaminobacter sp. JC074]|uniref:phosphotransferase n=1 Tax=Acidaminobacter sp. JC074 TaxID=2530199 RepID=UPI001F0D72C1|nr:phosphotransferase [Acidaminobacter sp. JC074]MCH4886242.1 hypothetical protein [Acidaminobacter sp. JC074]
MVLIDSELNAELSNSLKIRHFFDEDFHVKRFHLEEYDRDYDVFKLFTDKKSLILKKLASKNELEANRLLSKLSCDFVPEIYFFESTGEEWIAMEEIISLTRSMKKSDLIELTSKLVDLYSKSKDYIETCLDLRCWSTTPADLLLKLEGDDLTQEDIRIIEISENILNRSYKAFIHGDLIPLNMIVSNDGVKVLDWEHGKFGPYILDLSRLLGDYNINRPWIDPEWEEDILNVYYEMLKARNIVDSYEQMKLEYECGKLHNYFGIIRAFKVHGWERIDWYDLNMSKLHDTIKSIKEHLSM